MQGAAQKTYLCPPVATASYTAMRNTELRFLCWDEIDFDREVVTIRNKPELGVPTGGRGKQSPVYVLHPV